MGLGTIIVENELLRVVIIPELGGKIYDIVFKPLWKNILWHNPRISPRKVPFGVAFDDVWSGGWDEIFPNDAASVLNGEKYPDMGEIWSIPWDYSITNDKPKKSITVTISAFSPISTCKIVRALTLNEYDSRIFLHYSLQNIGQNQMRFLWKLHPAFAVNDSCTIIIDGGKTIVDSRYRQFFEPKSHEYHWPNSTRKGGEPFDVSKVRSQSDNTCTLHYVTELKEGSVALRNPREKADVVLKFPKEILNCVWLFLPYGGYRGIYNAVIEPSTSYPYDLSQAIQEGHYSKLDPNERLDADVELILSKNRE